ncbi:SDR family NAD(P)-dependent oxidoreductase [Kineococcus sp. SYSU DK003]|uniref:SDR family NAD(P)-dependent oxidoreductase n=1 Tax=Kineococcus sp. SYSU DK003 TaxID=3383124 RepID=UPI003D7D6A68
MRFTDKVAFVTGGASGLGFAVAQLLAEEGAGVVVVDIDGDAAAEAAARLPDAIAVTADTSRSDSVQAAVEAAVAHYGHLDVVFNNAGIAGAQQPLHEMDDENWNRVSGINGDGVFWTLKHTIAAMLQTGGGAIVNTASTAGLGGQVNISPYTFTKGGVVALTKSAAIEYAARGIRVNAVAPTVVKTPLVEKFIETAPDPVAMKAHMDSMNPKPGMPEARDVANVVAFLASDDSAWVTGHTIPVDGGYLAV